MWLTTQISWSYFGQLLYHHKYGSYLKLLKNLNRKAFTWKVQPQTQKLWKFINFNQTFLKTYLQFVFFPSNWSDSKKICYFHFRFSATTKRKLLFLFRPFIIFLLFSHRTTLLFSYFSLFLAFIHLQENVFHLLFCWFFYPFFVQFLPSMQEMESQQ